MTHITSLDGSRAQMLRAVRLRVQQVRFVREFTHVNCALLCTLELTFASESCCNQNPRVIREQMD